MDHQSEHLNCLDGLRGLAACVIAFIWHYQHFIQPSFAPFYRLFRVSYMYGNLLVELFFMLSGFGMMLGYGNRITKHGIRFPQYIGKRIRKLYPLFLMSTLIVIVLQLLIRFRAGEYFVYPNFDLFHLVLNLLLLQDGVFGTDWSLNSPSWVISILVLMYCLFFLICWLAKSRTIVCYISAFCALLGGVMIMCGWNGPLVNSLTGRGMACFFIGVLLCEIYEKRAVFHIQRIAYIGLLFIALAYILLRSGQNALVGDVIMLMVLGIAPLTILCTLTIPWLWAILSCRTLVSLGKLSFAVYLLHFPVQCCFRCLDLYLVPLDYGSPWIWTAYVAATLCAAWAYTFFLAQKAEAALISFFCHSGDQSRGRLSD